MVLGIMDVPQIKSSRLVSILLETSLNWIFETLRKDEEGRWLMAKGLLNGKKNGICKPIHAKYKSIKLFGESH